MTGRLSPKKMMMMKADGLDADREAADLDSALLQLEIVHNELDNLAIKENDEILIVEQKYKKLKQQCYDRRSEIVANIPDFWFNIFTSHPSICNILSEDEEDCLHYLHKLDVNVPDNIKSGYSIKLYFNENPYFKNDVLVKDFSFKQGNLSSASTKIEWKKPYPPASSAKDTNKGQGRKRGHAHQTFFGWFANNEDPASDIIAEVVKDDLWPNSLQYYLVPDLDMDPIDDKEDDSSDSSDNDEGPFENDKTGLQRDPNEGPSTK